MTRALTAPILVALLVGFSVGFTATWTGAQTQGGSKPRPARPRAHKADGGEASSRPELARGARGEAGATVMQKTPDGGKVFRFGEMEIEGRLKNPQLVFFLRRVRAEFAAGDLGHRSFLRELGETKLDPNF
jgi:hypothetical protein